jgi:hypothetical protein
MDSTASVLGDRILALVAALNDAGVAPERAAAILDSASAATAHVLTLVALRQRPADLSVVHVEAPAALAA